MALVAAMRPKSYGSSTMGMKKSVVATIACCGLIWYTAASSQVSVPTRSCGGTMPDGTPARIFCNTAGAILQPQPPPCDSWVSLGFSSDTGVLSIFVYSASKPASSMALTSASRATTCGSKLTFASPASSETSALATPASPPSTPVMFLTQPWQLMPPTLITVFSIALPVHEGLIAQHVGHLLRQSRAAEMVALRHVAAHFTQ